MIYQSPGCTVSIWYIACSGLPKASKRCYSHWPINSGLSAVHKDFSSLLSATYSTLRVNCCAFHPDAWPKPDARSNSRSLFIFFDGKKPMTVKVRGLGPLCSWYLTRSIFILSPSACIHLNLTWSHVKEMNQATLPFSQTLWHCNSCQGAVFTIERPRIGPPPPCVAVPIRGSSWRS